MNIRTWLRTVLHPTQSTNATEWDVNELIRQHDEDRQLMHDVREKLQSIEDFIDEAERLRNSEHAT